MYVSELRAICTDVSQEGRIKYDATMGIVSRIYDGIYEIFAIDSVTGMPQVGAKFDLQAVYCREVYEKQKTVALTEFNGVAGLRLHPLYTFIPCEMYISSPIIIDGSVWGTLNFTSLISRDYPFSMEDIQYNEAAAGKIAAAVSQTKL